MIRLLASAALLAALGGCVDTSSENRREVERAGSFQLTTGMMPGYCREEAATAFDQNPGDIAMGPVSPAGALVTVPGAAANGAVSFTCTFTAQGAFPGLDRA